MITSQLLHSVMDNLINLIAKKFNIDAHYFIKGGFWLFASQVSTIISSLIVAALMARHMTENDYGIYRYIIGLAALLSVFSLTGIAQSILQASSQGYKDFLRASIGISLKYSLGVTLVASLSAAYYFSAGNQILMYGCIMIAVLHPITQLFINTLSHLYGESKYATGAKMQAFKSVLVSGSTLLTLVLSQNILLLLVVYFLSQAIATLLSYYLYKPRNYHQEIIPQEIWNKYITYAKNTSYRNILIGVASRLDSIVIFQYLGASELALYSISNLLPDQIRSSLKNLQTLLLPKYTKHGSIETLKESLIKRSIQFFLLLTVATIVFILIVPPIYTALFPKYAEGVLYIQLLALSFPASIFLIPLGALQAQQKEKELYLLHITTSIIQIVTLLLLILNYGLVGAIVAKIIAQYLKAILSYWLIFSKK